MRCLLNVIELHVYKLIDAIEADRSTKKGGHPSYISVQDIEDNKQIE